MTHPPARSVSTVRVLLPAPLRAMVGVRGELGVEVEGVVCQRAVLDAVEERCPALRGTIRSHAGNRRPFIRFFACEEDRSHDDPDTPLPTAVVEGREPYIVLGAMAGG